MFGEIANRTREALSRADLGAALRDSGRIEDARHQWRLAIDILRQIGADDDAERVRRLAAEVPGPALGRPSARQPTAAADWPVAETRPLALRSVRDVVPACL